MRIFTYFDYVRSAHHIPIEEHTILYIVKTNDQSYYIKGISSGLDKLTNDPSTQAEKYWLLDTLKILRNESIYDEIFPNSKLRIHSLTAEEINLYLELDVDTVEPLIFSQAVRAELINDWWESIDSLPELDSDVDDEGNLSEMEELLLPVINPHVHSHSQRSLNFYSVQSQARGANLPPVQDNNIDLNRIDGLIYESDEYVTDGEYLPLDDELDNYISENNTEGSSELDISELPPNSGIHLLSEVRYESSSENSEIYISELLERWEDDLALENLDMGPPIENNNSDINFSEFDLVEREIDEIKDVDNPVPVSSSFQVLQSQLLKNHGIFSTPDEVLNDSKPDMELYLPDVERLEP